METIANARWNQSETNERLEIGYTTELSIQSFALIRTRERVEEHVCWLVGWLDRYNLWYVRDSWWPCFFLRQPQHTRNFRAEKRTQSQMGSKKQASSQPYETRKEPTNQRTNKHKYTSFIIRLLLSDKRPATSSTECALRTSAEHFRFELGDFRLNFCHDDDDDVTTEILK